MKNLRNYVILSVIIVMAVLVGMAQGVNASGTVLFPTSNSNTDTNTSTNITLSESTTENATGATDTNNNQPTAAPAANSIIVNNLNTNVTKDTNVTNTTPVKSQIPQTGENDIYIVSAIGVVALAIGTVAYLKSRKYDI